MIAGSARGAYVCARCQLAKKASKLRLVPIRARFFSQNHILYNANTFSEAQKSTAELAPDALTDVSAFHNVSDRHDITRPRLEATTISPGANKESGYRYKVIRPNGRIYGRSGRYQRENSERLATKSLDKDSEVIVLRDLPYEQSGTSTKPLHSLVEPSLADSEVPSAEELEQSTKEFHRPLELHEINTAIEQHRPATNVVDKKTFQQFTKKLGQSHNLQQLLQYMHTHLKAKIQDHKPRKEQSSSRKYASNVNVIIVTPWIRGNNAPIKLRQADLGEKKVTNQSISRKDAVIDAIFRKIWDIQTVEELDLRGDANVILSPLQWKLLNTRVATKLFTPFRSNNFYKRTKFTRDAKGNILRLSGPRSEVQGIIKLFQDAYASVQSSKVDLTSPSDSVIVEDQMKKQLEDVMQLTNTLIEYDERKRVIYIYAFDTISLEHGVRLLTRMFDRPRESIQTICRTQGEMTQSPMDLSRTLPSHARYTPKYRLVSPTRLDDAKFGMKDLAERIATWHKKCSSTAEIRKSDLTRALSTQSSIWLPEVHIKTCETDFGFILHDQAPNHLSQGPMISSTPSHAIAPDTAEFVPFIPKLTTLMSYFDRVRPDRLDTTAVGPRLVARLMSIADGSSTTKDRIQHPMIDVTFAIRRGGEDDLMSNLAEPSDRIEKPIAHTWSIGKGDTLELLGVRANLKSSHCNVLLPELSIDMRLAQYMTVNANLSKIVKNAAFGSFVDDIVDSLKQGSEIRAPPTISLPIPVCMTKSVSVKRPQKKSKRQTPSDAMNEICYMFGGFEYHDIRHFEPVKRDWPGQELNDNDTWTVTDVEAGFTGGRYTRLAMQANNNEHDLSSFVTRCFAIAKMIDNAQRGRLMPLQRTLDLEKSDKTLTADDTTSPQLSKSKLEKSSVLVNISQYEERHKKMMLDRLSVEQDSE